MHIDLTQFVGLTGVPVLEQVVQYLKTDWKLPARLAPLAALAVGVIVNVAIAYELHFSLLNGVEVGLLTGFSSSFWHEMAKAGKSS